MNNQEVLDETNILKEINSKINKNEELMLILVT
jgi:hypothetical protein